MCGLAGFVHEDRDRPADRECLRRMTAVLGHRGPDGEGLFVRGPLALGHRRLSIIDLATGDQPMSSPDGSLTISYNGEIYNYLELRQELIGLGHVFRTDSDTEVILEAYRQWGLDCQTRLNGMWAFALWDAGRQRLLLSRDRLGEKPLHYAVHDRTLLFASEIKGLLAGGLPARPDLSWIEVYGCLSFLPAPDSFFAGVRKLEAGCWLTWQDGRLQGGRYWDLPEIDEGALLTDAAAVEASFAELLADSVRLRMRSDVDYGAFLSGGLDSSCIVALMSDVSSHPVKTFTIGFDQQQFDERRLARLVAAKFATEHREQVVKPAAFAESLQRVAHHYDEPFGDASAIPTWAVSQEARRTVKMVLTGDGGDEALSGYTIYQGEKFAHAYGRLPGLVRAALPPLAAAAARPFRGRPRARLNRVADVLRVSALEFAPRLLEKISWADTRLVKALLPPLPGTVRIEDYLAQAMARCPYRDPFYRLMYYNLKISLPERMLVKVDRMSMAASLEVRTPFLDHRLVELMVRTDKRVKMRGFERKSVLRRTVARRLPPALLRAPKKGFAVPVGDWFRQESVLRHATRLAEPGGLEVAAGPLADVLERNRTRQRDYGDLLWVLVLLDRFCRGEAPSAPERAATSPAMAGRHPAEEGA